MKLEKTELYLDLKIQSLRLINFIIALMIITGLPWLAYRVISGFF
jgi:hypothetical protein